MPLFAVLVGAKSYCYLIPAATARKAEKVVWQSLNAADQINTDVVTAIPVKRLPSAKAKNAPQEKQAKLIAWPTKRKIKNFYQREKKSPRA